MIWCLYEPEMGLDATGSLLQAFAHRQRFHKALLSWKGVANGVDPKSAGHLHMLPTSMVRISLARKDLI